MKYITVRDIRVAIAIGIWLYKTESAHELATDNSNEIKVFYSEVSELRQQCTELNAMRDEVQELRTECRKLRKENVSLRSQTNSIESYSCVRIW